AHPLVRSGGSHAILLDHKGAKLSSAPSHMQRSSGSAADCPGPGAPLRTPPARFIARVRSCASAIYAPPLFRHPRVRFLFSISSTTSTSTPENRSPSNASVKLASLREPSAAPARRPAHRRGRLRPEVHNYLTFVRIRRQNGFVWYSTQIVDASPAPGTCHPPAVSTSHARDRKSTR